MSNYDPWKPEVQIGTVVDYLLVTDSKGRLYVGRTLCWADDTLDTEYIGPVPLSVRDDPHWPAQDYGWSDPAAPRPTHRRNARRWPVALALPDGRILTDEAIWDHLTADAEP